MQHLTVCKERVIARSEPKLAQTYRIMKLTVFIILVACMHVSAKGYSQKITISVKNTSLVKVFETITQQTGYRFFYNLEQLQKSHLVSIQVKDASLEETLSV